MQRRRTRGRSANSASTKARRRQGGAKPESSTATYLRAFKFHDDQIEDVDAAIDKAKKAPGAECDSAALISILMDFLGAHALADRLKKVGVETASKPLDGVAALGPSAATASVELTSRQISDRGRRAIRQRRPRRARRPPIAGREGLRGDFPKLRRIARIL